MPHPSLRTLVVGDYTGWTEQTVAPVRRLEIASPIIPLILNFGPSYRLTDGQRTDAYTCDSFVAGVYDTWGRGRGQHARLRRASQFHADRVRECCSTDPCTNCMGNRYA